MTTGGEVRDTYYVETPNSKGVAIVPGWKRTTRSIRYFAHFNGCFAGHWADNPAAKLPRQGIFCNKTLRLTVHGDTAIAVADLG